MEVVVIDFEFYETPKAFTRWLFEAMDREGCPIDGRVFEPCVGNGAIIDAAKPGPFSSGLTWLRNDLDPRWPADMHANATDESIWRGIVVDWTISNPPFTPAIEVLKTGVRRTWMAQHPPTGILWLPRFAYQRSKTTGKWTTDSVCACWVVWLKDPSAPQFIRYAPESVIDALDAETPAYRRRMDMLMANYKSSEIAV